MGLGGEEYADKTVSVGERTVNFYKLDKSKRYRIEGKTPQGVWLFLCVFSLPFVIIGICGFFSEEALSSPLIAVPIIFLIVGVIMCSVGFACYLKARKANERFKTIIDNCTLTDGTVTDFHVEERVSYSGKSSSTYYDVELSYSFYGLDGSARSGEFKATYSVNPEFFVGQSLMIAFSDDDSAVLSKFSLLEGAKQFAEAEAERMEIDFSDLSGKLLNVDTSKPIKSRAYSGVYIAAGLALAGFWLLSMLPVTTVSIVEEWGLLGSLLPACVTGVFFLIPAVCLIVSGTKRKYKLKKILQNPSFTKAVVFFRKTTFRGGSNNVFYRFKDADGGCHIERFKGQTLKPLMDGERVIVAYSGGNSEILSEYTLKRGNARGRVRR